MALNDPGSNRNDQDPWTGKSKQTPPNLEVILRNFLKKLFERLPLKNKAFFNKQAPLSLMTGAILIAGVLLIVWVFSGIFIVAPPEQAVILKFGKYAGTVGPGPHWIPRLIESAYKVNEQKISTYSYNSEMLTKDENIVSVAMAVQFRVGNARDYLFSTTHPLASLQQATASSLRQVIGHTNLEQVLTTGRERIRQEVQQQLTALLDRYRTGLIVTDIAMQPAKAPEEVKDAFDDAIKAQEDEQRFENQAQAYVMQVEPIAKGQAQRLINDAMAYKQQVVLNAQADVMRFLALLPQYEKSPQVTRERLYIEALENVFNASNKILIDAHSNNNVFYLPIDKLIQSNHEKFVEKKTTVTNTPATTAPVETTAANATDYTIPTGGYDESP